MRYGDVLPPSFVVPTSAFWLRKDLTEAGNPFKLLNVHAGDKVMDCGAYIGTFAVACVQQGAAGVVCYEAAPKNAALLRANVAPYGSILVEEVALTADAIGHVDLMMSGFSGANSILPSQNRAKSIRVAAARFRDRMLAVDPTVLKLDVEGAEYDMLASLRPGDLDGARELFVEFHPIEGRDAKVAAIRSFFEAEGFEVMSSRLRAFIAAKH